MDAPSRPLVAVDANVLMDLGAKSDIAIDAIETIRVRLARQPDRLERPAPPGFVQVHDV